MRFTIPLPLLATLRKHREDDGYFDDLMQREDAFLLDPGMGPVVYLTAEGRVIMNVSFWEEGEAIREATDEEAISYLVIGALKSGVMGLLDLIPPQPADGMLCSECQGRRWHDLPPAPSHPPWWLCQTCWGKGFTKG